MGSGGLSLLSQNLVNTEIFRPAIRALTDRPFTFLTVSRLTEEKGIGDLLLAVQGFRRAGGEARFRLVGSGPLDHYRNAARRLDVHEFVRFLGPMGREEVAAEMRSAQALVMPAQHESFGVVAIEAMASGIPVLATRSGGPNGIVTPEAGLLVDAVAPEALARGMAAIISRYSAFDRGAIAAQCRSVYSAEVVAEQIAALYRTVLALRSSAQGPHGTASAVMR